MDQTSLVSVPEEIPPRSSFFKKFFCPGSIIIVIIFSLSLFILLRPRVSDDDWDYLVFSQEYPITNCIDWKSKSENRSCYLPKNRNKWTIHGLWPNKKNTMGPSYCNRSKVFNETALKDLLPEMRIRWADVQDGTGYSFWQHEWDKHGTCAMSLPVLATEYLYFNETLNLNKQYDVEAMLLKADISPSDDQLLAVVKIHDALKNYTATEPIVVCIRNKRTREHIISEIRLCFEKNFALMDCPPIIETKEYSGWAPYTDCPEMVIYPKTPSQKFYKNASN